MLNTNLVKNILNEYKNNSISLAQAIDMLNILYTHTENPGNSPEISSDLSTVFKNSSKTAILSDDRYVVTDLLMSAGIANTKANQIKAAKILKEAGYIRMKSNGNVYYISKELYDKRHK